MTCVEGVLLLRCFRREGAAGAAALFGLSFRVRTLTEVVEQADFSRAFCVQDGHSEMKGTDRCRCLPLLTKGDGWGGRSWQDSSRRGTINLPL